MTTSEMCEFLMSWIQGETESGYQSNPQEIKDMGQVITRLKAAEELAQIVAKIESLPNRLQIIEQIGVANELQLFNRLWDYYNSSKGGMTNG